MIEISRSAAENIRQAAHVAAIEATGASDADATVAGAVDAAVSATFALTVAFAFEQAAAVVRGTSEEPGAEVVAAMLAKHADDITNEVGGSSGPRLPASVVAQPQSVSRAARVLAAYHGSPAGRTLRPPQEHTLRQARLLQQAGLLDRSWTPDWAISPSEHLQEILGELGCTASEFEQCYSLPVGLVQQLLDGQRRIDPAIALALEKALGVSANMWVRLECDYQLSLARTASLTTRATAST